MVIIHGIRVGIIVEDILNRFFVLVEQYLNY